MKRFGLWTAVVALSMGLFAGTAVAQEGTAPDWANKSGAFGVGFNTTLGGTNGIALRTYVTPLLGVQATFGFNISKQTVESAAGDTTTKATSFLVGLYGTYKLAYWQRGSLSGLLGFDIQTLSLSTETPAGDSDDSSTDFLIGIGLQAEWFPTQYLSVYLQGGLRLDLLQEDERVGSAIDSVPDRSGFELDLGADLLGAAGVVVWFN